MLLSIYIVGISIALTGLICNVITPDNPRFSANAILAKFKFYIIRKNTINNQEQCSICLCELSDETIESKIFKTKCNHYYHKECIVGWINSNNEQSYKCPLCLDNMNIEMNV